MKNNPAMSLPRPKPIPVQTRHQDVQQQHDDSDPEKELQARNPSWSADSVSAVVSVLSPAHLGWYGDSFELQQWSSRNSRRSGSDASIQLDWLRSLYPDLITTPGGCGESLSPPAPLPASSPRSGSKRLFLLTSFLAFWDSNMAVPVPSKAARDHLGMYREIGSRFYSSPSHNILVYCFLPSSCFTNISLPIPDALLGLW